jgi:DNA-binding MarR family transcriptional regulator
MTDKLKYLWIGQPVLQAQDLSWAAKIVLAMVDMLARKNKTTPGACTLSARQLADVLQWPESTLRTNLNTLIERGYLSAAPVYRQQKLLTRQLTVVKNIQALPNQTIKMSAAILYRQDLTWMEKLLLAYIDGFNKRSASKGKKTCGFFQKNATMAKFFGTTPQSIKTMLCRMRCEELVIRNYYGKQMPGKDLKYNGTRFLKLGPVGKYAPANGDQYAVETGGRDPVYQTARSRLRDPRSRLPDPAAPLTRPRELVNRSAGIPGSVMDKTPTKMAVFAPSPTQPVADIDTIIQTSIQTETERRNSPRSYRCVDSLSLFTEQQEQEQKEMEATFGAILKEWTQRLVSTPAEILFKTDANTYLTYRGYGKSSIECLEQQKFQDHFVYFAACCLGLDDLAYEKEEKYQPILEKSPFREIYGPILERMDGKRKSMLLRDSVPQPSPESDEKLLAMVQKMEALAA